MTTEWDRARELLAHPAMKPLFEPFGGKAHMLLRQYRIWLVRLMAHTYPRLCDVRHRCNFWLLYSLLQRVPQPFESDSLRELWQYVMARATMARYPREAETKDQERVEFIHEMLPELPLDHVVVLAKAERVEPALVAPEVSDVQLFRSLRAVPLGVMEDFAAHAHHGPRTARMAWQPLPEDPDDVLTMEPPRPGYELSLAVAEAATALPEEMPLTRRLEYAFQVEPAHVLK